MLTQNNAESSESIESIKQFVSQYGKVLKIEKMPGDASTRKYYRVDADQNQKIVSFIVMSMESFLDKSEKIPFLSIQKHLRSSGVDVPQVLGFDAGKGYILLEDLGDVTLLRCFQNVANAEVEHRYFERAIDLLVDMHTQTGPLSKDAKKCDYQIEGFSLSFDVEKLMWEVNFTIEHFYLKHLARNISTKDMEVIQNGFKKICSELAAEPKVFTHRDYHSRNIMVTRIDDIEHARFVMIDFQDARMGLCQYDLASLLRDSYYQLDEKQIRSLTQYYIEKMKKKGVDVGSLAHFDRMFDLMAIQRNFKAIGSFASFLNRRGNPAYLKFIGNTFENIRRNLLKYPEFKELREVLFHYYYF